MTDDQTNYVGMSKTNMAYMDLNHGIWSGNPKINTRVLAIKDFITDIDDNSEVQETATSGATKDQNTLWFEAGSQAFHICTGLKAYYIDEDDSLNFEQVNYNFWDFMKCKKSKALDRMKLIHDKAAAITIGNLLNYQIVALDITNLDSAIGDFADAQPVKRIMVADRKVATAKIADDIKGIRKEYVALDLLVDTMKIAQPEFNKGYHDTRIIYDMGKGHKTVELHVGTDKSKTAFENEFEAGYSFLVRNHSNVEVLAGLTSVADTAPESTAVSIAANTDIVLVIPKEAIGMTTRLLSIQNQSQLYAADVTIIMSEGISQSVAEKVVLTDIPK